MAQNDKPHHVLVIRLSAMGDVAMTVPVLSALTLQYPEIKVTILTKPFFKPLFSQLPNVTVLGAEIDENHKGVSGLWRLYKKLKRQDFTVVVDLHKVLRSTFLRFFFWFDSVPFIQIDKGREEKKALTSWSNKIFRPLTHTTDRYASVFAQVGLPLDLDRAPLLGKEALSARSIELVGPKDLKWVGIAPYAAHPGKMYPFPLLQEVIKELTGSDTIQILLFGGGNSEKQGLKELATGLDRCVVVAGGLSFAEELALISNLDLMLAMDSGNGHLAAMYGIPVITLWGITHPHAGFAPFRQDPKNASLADRDQFPLIPTSVYGNKMPAGYEKAMATIGPHQILIRIRAILK